MKMETNICSQCGAHCIEQPDFSLLCEHCGTVHFSEERKRKIQEQRQRDAAQRTAQQQAERNRLAAEERARRAAERAAQWAEQKKKIRKIGKRLLIVFGCAAAVAVAVFIALFVYFENWHAQLDQQSEIRMQDFRHIQIGDVVTLGHSNNEEVTWRVVTITQQQDQGERRALLVAECRLFPTVSSAIRQMRLSFTMNREETIFSDVPLAFCRVDYGMFVHVRVLGELELDNYFPVDFDLTMEQPYYLREGSMRSRYRINSNGNRETVFGATPRNIYVRPIIWMRLPA